MKSIYKIAVIVCVSLLMVGCGGGGSTSTTTSSAVNLKTGFLVDAPLQGVSYTCGSITGVTTSAGAFSCVVAPITFSIGSWVIGTINDFTADSIVYPQDLIGVARNDFNNSALIDLVQVLQSLDDDGNITNVITIDSNRSTLFDSNASNATIAEIRTILANANVPLVDRNSSIAHLQDTVNTTDSVTPIVTAPANIALTSSVAVANTDANIVAFLAGASATDNVAVVGGITNNAPASFPLGDTVVTFSAQDAAGNTGTATATVTVSAPSAVDTQAPVVTAPSSLTVQGTSASGIDATDSQIVAFLAAATATDNVGVAGNIGNDAPSFFPVGGTLVTFTAMDIAGNTGEATATVTVTAPPVTPPTQRVGYQPVEPTYPTVSFTQGVDVSSQVASLYAEAQVALKQAIATNMDISRFSDVERIDVDYLAGSYLVTLNNLTEVTANPTHILSSIFIRFRIGDDGIPFTSDDRIYEYSMSLEPFDVAQVTFSGPGADATWFTTDDVISVGGGLSFSTRNFEYTNTAGYKLTLSQNYYYGTDNIFFTGDDSVSIYSVSHLDASGLVGSITVFNGSGSDGVMFTADDDIREHTISTANANGDFVQSIIFNAVGADGLWYTADDTVSFYTAAILSNQKIDYLGIYAAGVDGQWFTNDDVITTQNYFAYDVNGYIGLAAVYTNIGADGIWFSNDDTASAVSYTHSVAGVQTEKTVHLAIGTDLKWATEDDTIQGRSLYTNSGALLYYYYNSGADGLWYTDDDLGNNYSNTVVLDGNGNIISQTRGRYYREYRYDASNRLTATVFVAVAQYGSDGLPRTADDVASSGFVRSYTSNGYIQKQYILSEIGADGQWFTSDDVFSQYDNFVYNADNTPMIRKHYNDAGSDGVWGTSDDVLLFETTYTYTVLGQSKAVDTNSTGQITKIVKSGFVDVNRSIDITFTGAGTDGVWETADDIATFATVSIYASGASAPSKVIYYNGSGSDGAWLTPDDQVQRHLYYTYEGNSSRILVSIYYNNAGTDGVWFTQDDVSSGYSIQVYDANGTNNGKDLYTAGNDGLWLTNDDIKSSGSRIHMPTNWLLSNSTLINNPNLLGLNESFANIPSGLDGNYTLTYAESNIGGPIANATTTSFMIAADGSLTVDGTSVFTNPVVNTSNTNEAIWHDTQNNIDYAVSSLSNATFVMIRVTSSVADAFGNKIEYGQYQ